MIDFVAKYFNLSVKDSAEKLAEDFSVPYEKYQSYNKTKDYPKSKFKEDFSILVVRSKYQEAIQSVENKLYERSVVALDECIYFLQEYPTSNYIKEVQQLKLELEKIKNQYPLKPLVVIMNKKDLLSETEIKNIQNQIPNILLISAKNKEGIEDLKNQLLSFVNTGALRNNETIVTNTRHYDSLLKALEEIQKVKFGLETNLSSDLMALDIKEALYQFGTITGQVSNDELLGNIFANFCIGK